MRRRIPASSGLFATSREISVCARLRGGAGRTRTSNQTVIAETRLNQGSPHRFTGGVVAAALDARSSCVLTAVSDHSGLSANRAGAQCSELRLIIVWLEVRVLPAPPRSLTQTEISRFSANRPELAGIRARILSLQCVDGISGAVSAPLSLPRKIAFPGSGNRCWWNAGQQLLGIPITLRRRSRTWSLKLISS